MPRGIYKRESVADRFWSKVDKNGPIPECRPSLGRCWVWTAAKSKYSIFTVNGRTTTGHRWAWILTKGKIPKGKQIDHLCRNHYCVRPSHLEPVTPRENLMRGNTRAAANILKTHCPKGHEYTKENTYIDRNGSRCCKPCRRAGTREWKKRVGYSQAKGWKYPVEVSS